NHHMVMDEPKRLKGKDLGMNPYEALLASLGGCTAMTMKMYAQRKDYDLHGVEVKLRHEKIYAEDCENCESKEGLIDRVTMHLSISGDLTQEQKESIYAIAEKCPVHRTLTHEVSIVTHNEA
ncbi:MAG: OsmC family protein, partial [Pseudomonadota bacterium]